VIDPVTVLYETLQDAAQHRRAEVRRDTEADLEMLDWQRIKRAYKRLMTDLVNLPMHVIVTARENELTEERATGQRKERVRIGWKPDAEKSTAYYFDTVIRLVPAAKIGREAIIEKDRTGVHDLNARVSAPSFGRVFDKAITAGAQAHGVRTLQSDAEASRIDAATTMSTEELADRDEELTSLGHIHRSGAIARGDGLRSDLNPRLQADGYLIGFRLEIGDRKAIPQVVAQGAIGAALYAACGGNTGRLHGLQVAVDGELFEVQQPGRRKFHRLMLEAIKSPDWTIPAPEDEPTDEEEAVMAALKDAVRTGDVDYDDDKLWEKVPEVGAPAA
jgi:hypothetical protein